MHDAPALFRDHFGDDLARAAAVSAGGDLPPACPALLPGGDATAMPLLALRETGVFLLGGAAVLLGLRLLGRRVVRADATQPLAAPLLG